MCCIILFGSTKLSIVDYSLFKKRQNVWKDNEWHYIVVDITYMLTDSMNLRDYCCWLKMRTNE